jgi:hypothetical protein
MIIKFEEIIMIKTKQLLIVTLVLGIVILGIVFGFLQQTEDKEVSEYIDELLTPISIDLSS